MTREEFQAMVQRLEDYATQNPKSYRTRVGLLAGLGYGYIWFILSIVVLLIVGLIWMMLSMHRFNVGFIKIALLLLVVAYAIIRSLWVKFPRPEGIPLTRDKAPKLFEMLDELTTALKAPKFHHVVLDDDFNAAVVQRPKLGLFGWQENYLLLGLPLMQALPPEQFRAVIAHELGHLSGNHSRFAGWIYRVAATWEQIQDSFSANGNGGAWFFEKFLNWYWPFFNAYSFVLRRADEYVADRCAAQLAGAQVAGDALINVNVKAHFLENKFWPDVYKRAEGEAEPPQQTFAQMARAFRENIAPQDARDWATKALRAESDYADTHPSLFQRLSALGYVANGNATAPHQSTLDESTLQTLLERAPLETPTADNAANFYLGNASEEFTQQLDTAWRAKLSEAWGQQHNYSQESKSKLQEIDAKLEVAQSEGKTAAEVLTEEEMWNRARWTGEFGDNTRAIELLQELLAAHPKHASGWYALGHLQLEEQDEQAIATLEQAMQNEPAGTIDACVALYAFLKEKGCKEEAETYRKRAEAHHEMLQEAQRERTEITPKDTFHAPQLSEEDLEKVRAAVRSADKAGEAYLVRKEVQHFPEDPCYVLAIVTRQSLQKFLSSEDNAALVDSIAAHLSETPVSFLFVLDSNTAALGKAIKKVEGSRIYSHKDEK
jgi:Zn-dependent protease with chaperone function